MRIAVICCYYGQLPKIYPYWLESCRKNSNITFFLVSDISNTGITGLDNVKQLKLSMEELRLRAEEVLGFKVSLDKPYRLCDFKPLYGLMFEKELMGFDFWGHCDMDMIFGDLNHFISTEILENYEKIYKYGHLSLYRNCFEINRMYQKDGARFRYDEVFTNPYFYSFDEYFGMPAICEKNGVRMYIAEDMADITTSRSRLYMIRRKNYDHQIFLHEKGKVMRVAVDENDAIRYDEFVYIHFKNRHFSFKANPNECYFITPNCFLACKETQLTAANIRQLGGFVSHKQDSRDKYSYQLGQIKKFLKMNIAEKRIYLAQR